MTHAYKSSVLRCDAGECGCPVCQFLHDDMATATLLRVIEVLDTKLAEAEAQERRLLRLAIDRQH